MNEFKTYHPIVNLIYFVAVIGFSMFFLNPICLIISLICSITYSVILGGRKAIKFNIIYMLPLLIFSALLNPTFNHQGVTVLAYFPSGNPLTMESMLYGVATACMLVSTISWFSCFNKIMTSDKLMYLFGKPLPALSLIFSMVLRFVPKFKAQLKNVANAQACVGKDLSTGRLIARAKNGINILSSMITWSLENAIDTADSMKSRGYGLPNRTAFSNYRFSKRDLKALSVIIILTVGILIGNSFGLITFNYYPSLEYTDAGYGSVFVFALYFALCIIPIVIESWEAYKWKSLKSKI